MSSVIRRSHPDEANLLSDLSFRSKAHWGYTAEFMEDCKEELTLTPEFLKNNLSYSLVDEKAVVGFYALEKIDTQEVELSHLFVEPNCIGQGCGKQLFHHARNKAGSEGYKFMIIQGDPNAEVFYRSVGAVVIGEQESLSIPGRMLPLLRIELRPELDSKPDSHIKPAPPLKPGRGLEEE